MIWRVDVLPKKNKEDDELKTQIKDLGFQDFSLETEKVYFIEGQLNFARVNKIARLLLADPVIQSYQVSRGFFPKKPCSGEVMVIYQPGIFDPVAASLGKAISDLNFTVNEIKTATVYRFGGLSRKEIEYIGPKVFYNPVIEEIASYRKLKKINNLSQLSGSAYTFELKIIDILGAKDRELNQISQKGCLALSLLEMKKIRSYYQKLNRNPTDCELETLAVLWSEHCGHKTFTGIIDYREKSGNKLVKKEKINNLLKSTVMKATEKINHPDCVSVFKDNAGIVKFDQNQNICFKVETHNHPSSIEPYGAAATGIGGVIRDVLGTGCGFKPFASVDVFCFSNWKIAHNALPKGMLHPRRIIKGVVAGVRDYGNRMGIPTIAGSVLFDDRFLGNPLVYCGTLGIAPKNKSFKKVEKGDIIIVCGAKTGRDGIHGATFSSQELCSKTSSLRSAVQIGNPIEEKKLADALIEAREKNLFTAITDCGAGGLSSAVTELASQKGAQVDLDKVPLKYSGLSYTEIWISESQERMVFFAKPGNLKELKKIFKREDVEMKEIGKVTGSKKLTLFYQKKKVADLDMDFIFNSFRGTQEAVWFGLKEKKEAFKEKKNYNGSLMMLLSSPNIAPKDWIFNQYDHEVQGGSVLKAIGNLPFQVNDAAAVRPVLSSKKAVVVGCGINPFYSDFDPYWMAALAMDEALRNIVATGAKLEKAFILDNFSWGSPENPRVLGGLVRAAKACRDYSLYYRVPFISGKDSLYNEYDLGKNKITIPGTLLISAVGILDDWKTATRSFFSQNGNLIYLLGLTKPELGGSEYFRCLGYKNKGIVPKIEPGSREIFQKLSRAISLGLVESCHDLSEGGLAVAISEMCAGSNFGADLFLKNVRVREKLRNYQLLFSESPTRFLVEVKPAKKKNFEKTFNKKALGLIGKVTKEKTLQIYGRNQERVVKLPLKNIQEKLTQVFQEFRWDCSRKN